MTAPIAAAPSAVRAILDGPALIQWLHEVEERLPVADWSIDGIPAWPTFRTTLYAQNLGAVIGPYSLEAGLAGVARRAVAGIGAWLAARVRDRCAEDVPTRPADAVFLATAVPNQVALGSRSVNPLVFPYVDLLSRLGRTCRVWEMSPYGFYVPARETPSAYIQPRILWHRARSLVFSRPRRPRLEGFAALLGRVARDGLHFRFASEAAMAADFAQLRSLADWFRKWLDAVRPRLGFVANYGPVEQAFCLACRETGVTSVETQHGVQGEGHPAYSGWRAMPPGGYATRPRVFWCWDQASAETITHWARETGFHRAVVGGDPWARHWDPGRDSPIARYFADRIPVRLDSRATRREVLVTLDSGGDPLPSTVIEILREAPADWFFWLRLHPVDQAERGPVVRALIEGLGRDNTDTELATALPLFTLLRRVDVHVTVTWSTVVQQADALGVASVACSRKALAFFPRTFERGRLVIAETPADLMRALRDAPPRAAPDAETGPDPVEVMTRLWNDAEGPAARVSV